ncbi:MAG: OmpA family protein, partial [Muribaculaceae bacterium]|nr:OmpA family protein [Muribaculaceae bacterium]
AKVLKQNPELKLRIVGHTSAEGDDATNRQLSEARAQAAVDFLVNREIIGEVIVKIDRIFIITF